MLNKKLFLHWIKIFEKLHGRDLGTDVFELFYTSLTEEFNDEQFTAIARRIFDEERFFPTPATFRYYRDLEIKSLAEAEWELVLKAATNGLRSLRETDFNERIEEAVRRLGGLSVIADCEITKLDKLKNQFLSNYKTVNSSVKRLTPAITEALWFSKLLKDPSFIEAQQKIKQSDESNSDREEMPQSLKKVFGG